MLGDAVLINCCRSGPWVAPSSWCLLTHPCIHGRRAGRTTAQAHLHALLCCSPVPCLCSLLLELHGDKLCAAPAVLRPGVLPEGVICSTLQILQDFAPRHPREGYPLAPVPKTG